MEGSEDSQRHVSNITSRVLAINFAAIHVSTYWSLGFDPNPACPCPRHPQMYVGRAFRETRPNSKFRQVFTQTLYNLAANPQYIQALRDEVEPIVEEEGWSRAAVAKMYKVDSFMKETQRMDGIGLGEYNAYCSAAQFIAFFFPVNMVRKTMKDLTFADGTVIPKGAFVAMAIQPMHLDNDIYDNADTFDPFRFASMRTEDGGGKHQFAVTSPEYLAFGHGRHAW